MRGREERVGEARLSAGEERDAEETAMRISDDE